MSTALAISSGRVPRTLTENVSSKYSGVVSDKFATSNYRCRDVALSNDSW
jgi:hypothetical protein